MPSSGKNTLSGFESVTRERRRGARSSAIPRNTGARSRPSRVRSVNCTFTASRGSIHVTSRAGVLGIFGTGSSGGLATRSGSIRRSSSPMLRSSRPLPTLPTQARCVALALAQHQRAQRLS